MFDATVTIGDEILSISASGSDVGDWPLKYCRVVSSDDASFALLVDGELAVFEPDDPRLFGLAAAQRFQASTLGERIDVMRGVVDPLPPVALETEVLGRHVVEDRPSWFESHQLPVVASLTFTALAALIVVATFDHWTVPFELDASPITTVVTTTTVAPATTLSATVFAMSPEAFRETWNTVVTELNTADELAMDALSATAFAAQVTDSVYLAGEVDPAGLIEAVTITIDPTGDAESDALAIDAIGVAMAVADPTLDGPERRALLASLGLDIADPDLTGLSNEHALNGVIYQLRFLPEVSQLLFVISEV